MQDRPRTHLIALFVIALALIGKTMSILFFQYLHIHLVWLEVLSIGTYFVYIGWVGYLALKYHIRYDRNVAIATVLVALDLFVYYGFKGWV